MSSLPGTQLRPVATGGRLSIQVPATSANLGPGYDSFGLALARYDELEISVENAGFHAQINGEGSQVLPTDGSHLILQMIQQYLARKGYYAPGLSLRAENRIPHSRGLGSSAAAYVAAAAAADALLPAAAQGGAEEIFAFASAQEGHPDNVAPAVYGGFTLCWADTGNQKQPEPVFHTLASSVHEQIYPVVLIPEFTLSTAAARAVLPTQIPHREAAENSARAALLAQAITRHPELLFPATEDYLHQAYRQQAMPATLELVQQLRQQQIPAMVSGAGPTVLCLAHGAAAAESICAQASALAPQWRVEIAGIAAKGVTVKMHRQ